MLVNGHSMFEIIKKYKTTNFVKDFIEKIITIKSL